MDVCLAWRPRPEPRGCNASSDVLRIQFGSCVRCGLVPGEVQVFPSASI